MGKALKTKEQVSVDTDKLYISLVKLTGLKIVDIWGSVNVEMGNAFQIHRVILEKGQELFTGGEHDCAWLEDLDNGEIMSDEQLEALAQEEENENDEEIEDE